MIAARPPRAAVVTVIGCGLVVGAMTVVRAGQDAGPLGPPPAGLDWALPLPRDNWPTPEAIALGKALFGDRRLSVDRSVSCSSCHSPEQAFSDRVPASRAAGGGHTRRNTPSLHNAGYRTVFFWDGRVTSLETQVLRPIVNPDEMDLPIAEAVVRLDEAPSYREAFESAFDGPPTERALARALASYVRTLRAGDSDFDRYVAGHSDALSVDAQEGLRLFRGRANCVHCHMGPLLADGQFHNTGVSWGRGDTGRMMVTGSPEDAGRFRTPSLRDVARTAPYMHDGSIGTLDEVVEFYNRGGTDNPRLDPEIRPLNLTIDERRQLVALLRAFESHDRPRSD